MSSNRLARSSLVCLFVASQLVAGVAFAAPGDDAPGQRDARDRYTEGAAAYEKGEYETAYVKFSQAFTVWKVQATRWNLAKAAMKTGRQLEAIPLLEQLLDDATLSAGDRGKVEGDLAAAKKAVGEIAVVAPPGASVSMDTTGVGSAPLRHPLAVQPGTHVVMITTKDPEKKQERQVRVLAGESVTVDFGAAGPMAPPVQPPRGPVRTRWPGAKIGTEIALGACAAGALGTSLAFFAVGNGQKNDAQDTTHSHEDRVASRSGYDTSKLLSTIFFYGGAACAVGAIAVPLLWKNERVVSGKRLSPVQLGLSPFGVSLHASF